MRRFFIAGAGFLNLMFIAGVSAQTAQPHAGHHPAEAAESAPSAVAEPQHDCPMMKDEDGHRMHSDGMHPPSGAMGSAQQMPDGMQHCSEMHSPVASEKPQQPRQ